MSTFSHLGDVVRWRSLKTPRMTRGCIIPPKMVCCESIYNFLPVYTTCVGIAVLPDSWQCQVASVKMSLSLNIMYCCW